jgi:hypothetical protein
MEFPIYLFSAFWLLLALLLLNRVFSVRTRKAKPIMHNRKTVNNIISIITICCIICMMKSFQCGRRRSNAWRNTARSRRDHFTRKDSKLNRFFICIKIVKAWFKKIALFLLRINISKITKWEISIVLYYIRYSNFCSCTNCLKFVFLFFSFQIPFHNIYTSRIQ